MKAVFIVLNKIDYLDDILESFLKIDIKGATILDSQGMASQLAENKEFSLMIGLNAFSKLLAQDSKPYSKTIFTIVKDEKVKEIADIMRPLADKNEMNEPFGFMFSLPIDEIFTFVK